MEYEANSLLLYGTSSTFEWSPLDNGTLAEFAGELVGAAVTEFLGRS